MLGSVRYFGEFRASSFPPPGRNQSLSLPPSPRPAGEAGRKIGLKGGGRNWNQPWGGTDTKTAAVSSVCWLGLYPPPPSSTPQKMLVCTVLRGQRMREKRKWEHYFFSLFQGREKGKKLLAQNNFFRGKKGGLFRRRRS